MLNNFSKIFLTLILLTANAASFADERPMIVSSVRLLANDANLVSLEKREILVYRLPSTDARGMPMPKAKYHFYVQGGLHGNEKLTSEFVLWLLRRVQKGQSLLNTLPSESVAIDFVPYANPDGVARNMRNNFSLVNLNRNFSYLWGLAKENPGHGSFSEPETKAIKYLFAKQKYTAAVDVHGYVNWVVAPSYDEKDGRSIKRRSNYFPWVRAIMQEMPLLKNYDLKTALALGDGGAFEDWAYWEMNSLALCLEMSSSSRFTVDLNSDDKTVSSVDSFLAYENFIKNMFQHAIDLNTENLQAKR